MINIAIYQDNIETVLVEIKLQYTKYSWVLEKQYTHLYFVRDHCKSLIKTECRNSNEIIWFNNWCISPKRAQCQHSRELVSNLFLFFVDNYNSF